MPTEGSVMLGILTKIVSKARSNGSDAKRRQRSREQESDGTGSSRLVEAESKLYECRSCNLVYIATEKTDCGNCDGTVEPIQDA